MKVGDRVGAILMADNTRVELLGYGIYAGDEVPHQNVVGMGNVLREINQPNPKLLLDSGKDVFGCECWWGSEEKVKSMIRDRQVVGVDIDEVRLNYHPTPGEK